MKPRLIIVLIAALLAGTVVQGAPTMVKARLDSALLLMGKTSALHVEIVQDKGVAGTLTADHLDTLSAMVEIAGRTVPDTVDL